MDRELKLYDKLLRGLEDSGGYVIDSTVAETAAAKLQSMNPSREERWMFWPPRAVRALEDDLLIPFIGAGLSVAAGVPTWTELLRNQLKLTRAYTEDTELAHDPLTMAEIASQRLGSSAVQEKLRELTGKATSPTASHVALAALRCQVYITTNYDQLLEKAWERATGDKMEVVVNDSDIVNLEHSWQKRTGDDPPLLFKIHGCGSRRDEQLILTRSDYRHHYRANQKFFEALRAILQTRHVLFAGFSHRDPEVTRLVEDAIYEHERTSGRTAPPGDDHRPHFYSLQFDMLEHTPEIFAAKGLVALRPPFFPTEPHTKSLALCVAIGELTCAHQYSLDREVAIDNELHNVCVEVKAKLDGALRLISEAQVECLSALEGVSSETCRHLLQKLGDLASQGVYLLDNRGDVKEFAVPTGLDQESRATRKSLHDRPYFRIVKSFRQGYVSDTFKSVFNGNSTFAVCQPLLRNGHFKGLAFAACQIGQWRWLLDQADTQWRAGRSFLIIDSNGVALLPPNNEITLKKAAGGVPGESPDANLGYRFEELLALSRRDALIKHLVENIVPLSQDDDVLELSSDFEYYSVVTEIRPMSRWKLAIAQPTVRGEGFRERR